MSQSPYRLLAPGPVPVPPQVLAAMSVPVLHHRTPQFAQTLKETWAGLKQVFATSQPVTILAGSGSAAMEAAIVNTCSPGDEVFCVVSGKFGERWAEMCEHYGLTTHRWKIPWGDALDLDDFEKKIKSLPQLKMVLTQVCETSTATLHPIEKMSALCRKYQPQALFACDAITAMGCLPLPMDDWGLDVVVAGSQKAFMIPTGLSFIALSKRAWVTAETSRLPKFYFNLLAERAANEKGDTLFSTPTSLILGLNLVLQKMVEVGLPAVTRRCSALREATRLAAPAYGACIFSLSPSPSVSAIALPADSAKVRDWLEVSHNITVMGGQDQLKGRILRIGHMGHILDTDMIALFEALEDRAQTDKWTRSSSWSQVEAQVRQCLSETRTLFA